MNQESIAEKRQKRYEKFVNAALAYQKKKDLCKTALCIQIINSEKLYLEGGYNNIYDCGMAILNVARGTVSNYVMVARAFINPDTGLSVFATEHGDFNLVQLLELKKLKKEEVDSLIKGGMINFRTPANEIKALVATYLGKQKEKRQKEDDEAREERIKPIKDAYEAFHKAFNALNEYCGVDDVCKEYLQQIMDSVVVLYHNNDRLWTN